MDDLYLANWFMEMFFDLFQQLVPLAGTVFVILMVVKAAFYILFDLPFRKDKNL